MTEDGYSRGRGGVCYLERMVLAGDYLKPALVQETGCDLLKIIFFFFFFFIPEYLF